MSDLHAILRDYLSLRRSLGFKLRREEILLTDFVAFLEKSGTSVITNAGALAWARKTPNGSPTWWAVRLDMVRPFARYVQAVHPETEVPPYDLLPSRRHRPHPYIFADHEVTALMEVVHRTRDRFRADSYRTLIGLLASTGLRVGEAMALDQSDLNPEEGILTVRHGKFGKSRHVPLHATTLQALEEYGRRRNHRFHRSSSSPLFLSIAGTRLSYKNFQFTFFHLVDWAGLAERKPRRPRIHDLRHTFAVRTLIDWYRAGLDVERQLPILSTYLGHVDPKHTYRYLSSVPELLGVARQRLERSMEWSR